MEPLRTEESDVGDERARSSASDQSSLSPLSGYSSPDGLGAPEDYCKQVSTVCLGSKPDEKPLSCRTTVHTHEDYFAAGRSCCVDYSHEP